MMRFFMRFFCRNSHSPLAQPLRCTKMPTSVRSPTWRTTWWKSKVLKHWFINSSTRVILKLPPLKPRYKKFGKPCSRLPQGVNNHNLAPNLISVGTTSDLVRKLQNAASLASFKNHRETSLPVSERSPRDRPLSPTSTL